MVLMIMLLALELTTDDIAVIVTIVLGIVIMEGLVILAILRAARFPPPTQLAVALSVLGIMVLGGYVVFGEERQELVALGGTVIGALAGALTQVVTTKKYRGDKDVSELGPGPMLVVEPDEEES